MSDWADKAAEREQELRDDALAAHARQAGRQAGEAGAEAGEDSAICGEPIPAARRAALPGVQTCIKCQGDLERELNNVWRVVG